MAQDVVAIAVAGVAAAVAIVVVVEAAAAVAIAVVVEAAAAVAIAVVVEAAAAVAIAVVVEAAAAVAVGALSSLGAVEDAVELVPSVNTTYIRRIKKTNDPASSCSFSPLLLSCLLPSFLEPEFLRF
ncbi:antifreeze protein Maxi-like [Antechinus flavipes]|uniref:antifreeze protein Maxi-like n=1 Tax=Antechinus flavipes TaxID=38775 RepID=UPI0022367CD8|nr:antifreeze protein Maxi-like [Antechinus flavipes]